MTAHEFPDRNRSNNHPSTAYSALVEGNLSCSLAGYYSCWEDRREEVNKRKSAKYRQPVGDSKQRGWRICMMAGNRSTKQSKRENVSLTLKAITSAKTSKRCRPPSFRFRQPSRCTSEVCWGTTPKQPKKDRELHLMK